MSPRLLALLLAILLLGTRLAAQEPDTRRPLPARTSLGFDAGRVSFADSTAPWTLGALSLARRTVRGTIIARVNVAKRFGTTGTQYEADAYPRLSRSTYAYLNAGYSSSSVFPGWRLGAEAFTSLPLAYEASLGVRQLRFAGLPVTLFTGSVGRYVGNYWFSLRPYVRSSDLGVSTSAGLTARRYYETADEYIGARAGVGTTPTDHLIATELTRTSSVSAGIHGSRSIGRRLIGTSAIDYDREQLGAGRTRSRVALNAGARVDF